MTIKHHLLAGVAMTPSERSVGRYLRAPEGHGGDDDSGGVSDNSNVNSDNKGTGSQSQDNSGDENLDLTDFWKEEDNQSGNDDDPAEASKRLGGEIGGMIEGFKTAPFTADIAKAIAEGDFNGVNEALTKSHQETIKQAVQISAKLVGAVMDRMTKDFDSRINAGFSKKDESEFLRATFPQAKDPAMAPMVQRVWDQAIANAKGDRTKATRLTRGMLNAFGAQSDLTTPPNDPTHGIDTRASKSFVEDLLGR